MTRAEKKKVIDGLTKKVQEATHIYIADTLGLDAATTGNLRRECFKNDVELIVAKNTLLKKSFENSGKDLSGLFEVLAGPTAVMLSETGNKPAKLIKEFRKSNEKPILKGAFVEEGIYIGDDQLDTLVAIKSKFELIADVIGLLQSPAKNVISALQSGGNTITGVLKTLEERG